MATITDAKIIVTSPGRNFVTLKITTSDGVTGLGDATLNGRELAVASYLRDHVAPLLIGRDPARIEDTWQYLYKGAYWRRGPVTMTAIAAVDTALWDVKGKVAGLPVYDLLGGKAREGAMVYGHASGGDVAELLDDVARFRELGYQAVRAQAAVPGAPGSYGVRHGQFYEPANATLPEEQTWSTEAYLDFAPACLGAVRERFGFDFHLLHDVHHRLTPTEAGRLGRRLRHPGVHGTLAAHARGLPAVVRAARGGAVPVRRARPGRGAGRGGRRALPVRAEVPAGQPPGRRLGARLVSRAARSPTSEVPSAS
ncbi:hypothetical protein [Microtetraspora niveoalba]|uniref:hypothetical protein n=1 Tax=Microtetraspora niveoalba TaxID=46175 RepID=UPI000A64ABEA|nr:hypothetical protein [Microtetraspora niveoalba]